MNKEICLKKRKFRHTIGKVEWSVESEPVVSVKFLLNKESAM